MGGLAIMDDEYCPVCLGHAPEFIGNTTSGQGVYLCLTCHSFYGVKTDTEDAWILGAEGLR